MSKFDKIKQILKIATPIAGAFIPGAAGSILDAVTKSINDDGDPQNVEGLKALAKRVDELEAAVLILAERK
jgi:hypothetical protein